MNLNSHWFFFMEEKKRNKNKLLTMFYLKNVFQKPFDRTSGDAAIFRSFGFFFIFFLFY